MDECPHEFPVEYGASDVNWRTDRQTGFLHAPCDACGVYVVWEVS